ncbi:MAG: RluA family pseudouridine synthase [Micavibrio aeruginosavorus]|uniref:RluA family pseudouridine synthase n=1 Tax=Micavibrio aeruginosavorus TaxID=349221 RepID=A0A2W5FLT4_9BACT|nr:MAG: RluA family pseudouridine synthase [Micavibrio aeruginosavorus]
MTGVRSYEVAADDDGQRLDRWLKKTLDRVPYALLQKMVRTGQVRVDGKRAKTDSRLVAGQTVRVPPVETKVINASSLTFIPKENDEEFLKSITVYDDGELLVLNKPYGLPVQGGPNIKRHIDGMLGTLINLKGVRPRLVHRLDRDTSGLLVCARSLKMTQSLGKMFESQDIKKIYWALVSPVPDKDGGDINGAIIKGEGRRKEAVVIDNQNGKPSRTSYRLLEKSDKGAASMAFWPRTGRMHQIRVHTADILGCPIIGDEKYNGLTPIIDDTGISGRLHLHAVRKRFSHPKDGSLLDLVAKLPEDLAKSWNVFGFTPDYETDPFERKLK